MKRSIPGELGKALEILAAGGEVDYQGATGVELIGPGESAGSYREIEVQDGKTSLCASADTETSDHAIKDQPGTAGLFQI